MIRRRGRIGALPTVGHGTDRRDRADAVVPAFDAPRRDRDVMHRAAQREVRLHVPLERTEFGTRAAEPALERRMIGHGVEDREPMPRRRLGARAIGPELRQHARVVAARHHLRFVRCPGRRVGRMPGTLVAAVQGVIEIGELVERRRQRLEVAAAGGRDVDHHAVALVEVAGPDGHKRKRPLVDVRVTAMDFRRRAWIVVHVVTKPVPEVGRAVGVGQRKRRDRAPLGAQGRRLRIDDIPGLVDVLNQCNRLPAIEVDDRRVARLGRLDRRIDRQVVLVRVSIGLVGTVLQAVGDVALGDTVADSRGPAGAQVCGASRLAS